MPILTQNSEAVTQPAKNCPFSALWVENPSWSPIHLRGDGWTTAKRKSGKPIPLSATDIDRAYRPSAIAPIIGKRFGKLTNYLMIDIDKGSLYHPSSQGIDDILEALEELGLCRYIIIQSSSSTGLHVYFPLPQSFNSWAIASTVHSALTNAGINIAAGQCELFPNKKQYGSDYNGHRLPLQSGSFILDDDFAKASDSLDDFVKHWAIAASGQDVETLQQCFGSVTAGSGKVALSFTAIGQTNNIMLTLAKQAIQSGLTTVGKVAEYISKEVRSLPGYEQFVSTASKRDIEKGWPTRAAKYALKSRRAVRMRSAGNYRKAITNDAMQRIDQAIELAFDAIANAAQMTFYKFATQLLAIGKQFSKGFSLKTLYKYKAFILKRIAAQRAKIYLSASVSVEDVGQMQRGEQEHTPSKTFIWCKSPVLKEHRHLHHMKEIA